MVLRGLPVAAEASGMTTPVTLTRAQKAAAILVAMGKPSASRLLKFFKQEELKALIEGARLLRTIPQSDLERIVAEFEAEFTEGRDCSIPPTGWTPSSTNRSRPKR